MIKYCTKCGSLDLEVIPVDNIHKIKTQCADCGTFIKFGKLNDCSENGTYEFILEIAEEINKTFILFKLVNDNMTIKKQIWKDEKGRYSNNLNRFIKDYSFLKKNFVDLYYFLQEVQGRKVNATIANITKKGKQVCEIKSLDKII